MNYPPLGHPTVLHQKVIPAFFDLLIVDFHVVEVQSFAYYVFNSILHRFEQSESADQDDEERHDLVVVAAKEWDVFYWLVERAEGRTILGIRLLQVYLVEK